MITLKEMRKNANMSVQDVAKAMDISVQLVYKWESGTRGLPALTLQQLYKLYDQPHITLDNIKLPTPPPRTKKVPTP